MKLLELSSIRVTFSGGGRSTAVFGWCLAVALFAPTAPAGQNLLSNGGFEKGLNEGGEPIGWHTKLTSIIPEPEYTDPENKKGRTGEVHFKCGCGHDWGTVRPWAMLVCQQCRHTNTGLEDSGAVYMKNHEYVEVVPGKAGKAVRVTLSRTVGNNQGVRVISHLVKAERESGYEIAFDAISTGPHLRVFVEGFRETDVDKHTREWVRTLPPEANPLEQRYRLKRVFRAHVNAGAPKDWSRFTKQFVAPKRYGFDHQFVTLYAYLPGQAAFDNIVLRKLTRAEKAAYLRKHPPPKEKRLR